MKEDVHFYVDNAPPDEVVAVISLLHDGIKRKTRQIAIDLLRYRNFAMQKDTSYTPRRLMDLGLAERSGSGTVKEYTLTAIGHEVARMVSIDRSLALDVLHYLHFTPFAGAPPKGSRHVDSVVSLRKYLWSYRRCCVRVWAGGQVPDRDRLAGEILADMVASFPTIDFSQFVSGGTARAGGRFDGTGVGRVMAWLQALEPSPIPEDKRDKRLIPREVDRVELALLALDDVYRARGYAYGDPVIMDEALLRQAAGVFFLDLECCTRLIQLAARLFPRRLTMRGTLEGALVVLHGPYTVEDVAAGLR